MTVKHNIDVVTPDGIAVHVHDAVAEVAAAGAPELLGRLVQVLTNKGMLDARDLRLILPQGYEVRE